MFSLENEVKNWKRELNKHGRMEEGQVEELESYLRDCIDDLRKDKNYSDEEAFYEATKKLAFDSGLEKEYQQVNRTSRKNISDSVISAFKLSLIVNYLKVASRLFFRDKIYSMINITGLAIGLTAAFILGLWVDYELSYDKFHEGHENIYRVLPVHTSEAGEEFITTRNPALLSEAMEKEIPEILISTRFAKSESQICKTDDVAFNETGIASCDPSFLKLFSFPIVKGDFDKAFEDQRTIVVTEKLAEKYFGHTDVIGKTINWNNWQEYKIGAVIKNVPDNSHLQFEFLTTFEIEKRAWPGGFTWENFNRITYVKLIENADVAEVEKKMTDLLLTHSRGAKENKTRVQLQPLEDIHLNADIRNDPAKIVSKEKVTLFLIAGIMILAIACFNFINLSFAKASKRLKEIGIRKTIGANKYQAFTQQIIEILFQVGVATIIAAVLIYYILPVFNSYTGNRLDLSFTNVNMLILFILMIFATTIISGVYPAIIMSGIEPVKILKKDIIFNFNNSVFRKGLVVFQFAVSLVLIICTLTIYNQYEYAQALDLGFNKSGLIRIPIKDQMPEKYDSFKNSLLSHPQINSVSIIDGHPMDNLNNYYVTREGGVKKDENVMQVVSVGYDYFDVMQMNIIQGRAFSNEYSDDNLSSVILNETAAGILNFKDPIGKVIQMGNNKRQIVGIIKDAKIKSLYTKVNPQVYRVLTDLNSNVVNLFGAIIIRYSSSPADAVEIINSEWAEVIPDFPIVSHFLDEDYTKLYDDEKLTMQLLALLAVLAIFVSTLGVFGLSAISLQNRLKEIGIRKTLGASMLSIVYSYLNENYKLVAIASVAAIPLGYYLSIEWLQKFEFNTGFRIESILIGSAILVFSILISLSYYGAKSYIVNPADVLRDE